MKLLIDARMAHPPSHGIARYTLNLVKGLKGHVDQYLLVSSKASEEFFRKETPWVSGFLRARVSFANPLDSIELSLKNFKSFDVVHFTSFSVPLKMPRRSVVTIHDLIHLKPGGGLLHKVYYNSVVKHALQKTNRIISVSDWTKKDLVETFDIDRQKIKVIPNGLESQWFADTPAIPIESKFRESKGLHTRYICSVSNPKPHKNLKTLLSACETLWNSGALFELALVMGREKLPEEFNVNPLFLPRIKFLTRMSEQDLMALYRYAEITVNPSQFEGYSFPIAESLAMKTPVVLSRSSAHVEFNGDGLTFYEPFDSTEKLAEGISSALAKKMNVSQISSNIIDHFELARRTLEVYREALKS